MANVFVDLTAGSDGSGSVYTSPRNVMPTTASNNTYLFAGGKKHTYSAAQWTFLGTSNCEVGSYDPANGNRVYPTPIGRRVWSSGWAPVYDFSKLALLEFVGDVQTAINMSNATGVLSLDGIRLWYRSTHATGVPIYSSSVTAGKFIIRRCELWHDLARVQASVQMVQLGNTSPTSLDGVIIEDNYIHDVANDGVWIGGQGNLVVVQRNIIERCSQIGTGGDPIQTYVNQHGVIVRRNWCLTGPATTKQGAIIELETNTTSWSVVEENYFECPANNTTAGVAIYLAGGGKARRNEIRGPWSRGVTVETRANGGNQRHAEIVSNLVALTGSRQDYGIFIDGAHQKDVVIVGNTLSGYWDRAIYSATAAMPSGSTFKSANNHIDCQNRSNSYGFWNDSATSWVSDNDNLVNITFTTPIGSVTLNGMTQNAPGFIRNYELSHTSPLRAAGKFVGGYQALDGSERPNPPSVGATEVPVRVRWTA